MLSEETLNYLKNRRKMGATKSLLIGNTNFPFEEHRSQNTIENNQTANDSFAREGRGSSQHKFSIHKSELTEK